MFYTKKLPTLSQTLRDSASSLVQRHTFRVNSNKVVQIQSPQGWVTMAPESLHSPLLQAKHAHPTAGHLGQQKTLQLLLADWWWPNIQADVKEMCTKCEVCNRAKAPTVTPRAPLGELPPVSSTFQRVHVDLLELPQMVDRFKYVLVAIDAFSKWCELIPIQNKAAETVVEAFTFGWLTRYGPPRTIHSDKGTEFTNKFLKGITEKFGIAHTFSSTLHPQSNGAVERLNRDIIAYLRKYFSKIPWTQHLPFIQWAHNAVPHSSTNLPPTL